jgi:hypothetical protein
VIVVHEVPSEAATPLGAGVALASREPGSELLKAPVPHALEAVTQ